MTQTKNTKQEKQTQKPENEAKEKERSKMESQNQNEMKQDEKGSADADQTTDQKESTDKEFAELKEKLAQTEDMLLRERAEFQNYRKRTIKEKGDIERFVMQKILTELLPALDSFDQVFHTEGKNPSEEVQRVLEGVKLIQKQLWEAFTKFNVEEFDPTGDLFDPNGMEALTRIESDEVENEIVDQVYQKGYKIGDHIVRPARVAVKVPIKKEQTENQQNKQEDNKNNQEEKE
ncbi:MAG: nucleotide exchange factor GrpE [Candidatus Hydrogenedentota bacterium]|nr:MAG: nucleotide exchange factor GrpE [Candidatus Hydrogenedentota bacterium]